jgi:endo-1,4-beta-xylanase
MVRFTSLAFAFTVSGALAVPFEKLSRSTPSETGTNNGYYYSFYTDGTDTVTYTNGAAGEYTMTWSGGGNVVGGKGWNPGSAQ